MDKVDLKKELKSFYSAKPGKPAIVTIPALNFLMIDGTGDPNTSPGYAEAVSALFALAYGLKFRSKGALGRDYAVMPLEGLWWSDDPTDFTTGRKDNWSWTMMILQPDWITTDMLEMQREAIAGKKPVARLDEVRLERFEEGRVAQVLHLGPYAEEGPTIAALHAFIADAGRALSGKHHEIYLGMPGRGDPAKLKTIIRQPMR